MGRSVKHMINKERKRGRINHILIYFKRLCKYNSFYDYTSPQIKERTNISFEKLKMAVFLTLDEMTLCTMDDPMKEIEEILVEDFVVFCSPNKELVTVTGIRSDEGEEVPTYFYLWVLFQYTYKFEKGLEIDREKFIWRGLMLPYFNKREKFYRVKQGDLKSLIKELSIGTEIMKTLKTIDYSKDGREIKRSFVNFMEEYVEDSDYYPNRNMLEDVAEEFGVGLSSATRILRAKKER